VTTRRATLLHLAAAGLCSCPALAPGLVPNPHTAYPQTGQPSRESGEPSEALFAALFERSTDPIVRAHTADALIARAGDPAVLRQLQEILVSESQPQEPRLELLSAISRSWSPSSRLLRPLLRLAESPTNAPPSFLFPAVAAFRTPEVVSLLVRKLSIKEPEATRLAAAEALILITGRDDLGGDRIAWQRWFDQARSLDTVQWRDLLASGVSNRQQRLAAERAGLAGRMTDALRRLYLSQPADSPERARLLAQLLADAVPEARTLGLDLLSRELSAGRTIDATVVEAAATLLECPEARVRSRAAVLATQLAPTNVAERLAMALSNESSPEAAASLLPAVARWPTRPAIAPTLRWLEQGPTDFPAAIDALLAFQMRGLLDDEQDRARALAVLRKIDSGELSPAACRLLAAIGEDQDRQRIADLFDSAQGPVRTAAAEALAAFPTFLDRLLAAATTDSSLFEIAVEAVIDARPTADGYAALALLPCKSEETKQDGLMRASLVLPPADLLRVATEFSSDDLDRESLLSRLTDPTVEAMTEPDAHDAEARILGLCMLAETRMNLKRPDRALQALETIPETLPQAIDADRIRRLRTVCLLWTNQIERAAREGAAASVWIAALELALAEPHAQSIATEIRRRFDGSMSQPDVHRYESLVARLERAGEQPRPHGDQSVQPES
jgi:hypothetical protein